MKKKNNCHKMDNKSQKPSWFRRLFLVIQKTNSFDADDITLRELSLYNSLDRKGQNNFNNVSDVEKKLTLIHRSTRTAFKPMIPVHHHLRMRLGWYYRWHLACWSAPTHWLTLVAVIVVLAGYLFFDLHKIWDHYTRADEPLTFTSENALYSGDFEGVNGIEGLNQGWASNDTTRTDTTDFGWNRTNFTRDAHGGNLAYISTTDSATYGTQYRTMEFDLANEEFTLSGWMKANDLVVDNNGGIVMNYSKAGVTNFYEVKIIPGKNGVDAFTSPDTWQYFTTAPTTFAADALGANFQIALNGPNWSGATNATGAAITFDDLSLTFTSHPTVTLNVLTPDPLGPIYGATTTITCPDPTGTVPFTFPNCFTKDSEGDDAEVSEVYARITIPSNGQSAYFSIDGQMGNLAPVQVRYISYIPNLSYLAPQNSELYLAPGESSGWVKISYPYIYLNALDGSTATQQLTKYQPKVFFNALSGGSMVSDAKFEVEIARDAVGADIVNSHSVDGASSAMVSIPRHVPLVGDSGINFALEEASYLDDQATSLDLENSIADQLTEVHFSTGHGLGKDYLDDSLYSKQNSLLRNIGINGLNLVSIQGPQSEVEKQQEAENQGFTNHAAQFFLNAQLGISAYDYPLQQSRIDTAVAAFAAALEDYDKDEIKGVWIFEETGPPSIQNYVASSIAQASFRLWLADLGLTPADFSKSSWNEVSMVIPQNAEIDEVAEKEWYYTAKFRYETITRFTKAVSSSLKAIVPNAILAADHTDGAMISGNAIRHGVFWPDYARNSGLNGMMTAYWQTSAGSALTASWYSAMLRSGLDENDFDLWARMAYEWHGKAMKQEIYSSLLSGAKMFDFFDYGPDYLSVTDSASYVTNMMQAIKESSEEFVPVQSQIKNSSRAKSETAVLYSETSDIWHWVDDIRELGLDSGGNTLDKSSTLDRERQGIYFALENNQIPTDIVTEQNINLDNALDDYKVLYVIGPNISSAAQQKIAGWVSAGGIVYATVGAGMKDEYNQPSTILSDTLGLDYSGLNINYIIQEEATTRTSCQPTLTLRYMGPLQWNNGHLYTTTDETQLYGYCAYMDPLSPINNITDPNMEIIEETDTEPLFMKRRVGSGYAYYSNFFAGIAYLTKASIKYKSDRPYIAGLTYDTLSFSDYPGDDELAIMLTPYNQSDQQRTVELSGDESNSPKSVQTGVLSGTYSGKSYYLIPMNNFNQEVDGDPISKTLKVTINTDPDLVDTVYSVKLGSLSFSKVTDAIEINSYILGDTDILKVEFNSPVIPPISPIDPRVDDDPGTDDTITDPSTTDTTAATSDTTTSASTSGRTATRSSQTDLQTNKRVIFGQSITLVAPNIQSDSTYSWDFGDGTKATGASVTHYYQQVNRYTVTLTVKNSAGTSTVTTYTVDVVPPQPELTHISSDKKDVTLEGKALAETEILIMVHSDPFVTSSDCGTDGNFKSVFDFGTTGLAYGDHKIVLIARKTLDNGTTLDSDPKNYDAFFNLTEENTITAGLKEAKPWYKQWYWIVCGAVVLASIVFFVFYYIYIRKNDIDHQDFSGSTPIFKY